MLRAVAILVVVAFGLAILGPYLTVRSAWNLLALNALPLLLFETALFLLSGRLVFTVLVTTATSLAIYYAHHVKFEALTLPLSFADVVMVPQFLGSPALLLHYGSWWMVLAAAILILGIVVVLRIEKPAFRSRARLGAVFLSLLPLAVLGTGRPVKPWYQSLSYTPWYLIESTSKNGLLASLFQQSTRKRVDLVPEPDRELLAAHMPALKREKGPSIWSSDQRPDIILWLSEAFFDPGRVNGLQGCDFIPNACELKTRHSHGELIVPTYGGTTIRTEFEMLTGTPMTRIAGHAYPYLTLGNRKIHSIAWHLRKLGYRTTAMHTHYRSFWNRNVVLPNLGFQHWIGKEDIADTETDGYYVSDRVLTDRVMRELDQKPSPQLIFAISMQAHGPWKDQQLPEEKLPQLSLAQALIEDQRNALIKYLYHLRAADRELGRLARFVAKRERPTVLLFFGDHLPALTAVFDSLGFKNGETHLEQTTDYLLISNIDQPPIAMDLAVWQLPVMILQRLGLAGDSRFALFAKLYDELGLWEAPARACGEVTCRVLEALQILQLHDLEAKQ